MSGSCSAWQIPGGWMLAPCQKNPRCGTGNYKRNTLVLQRPHLSKQRMTYMYTHFLSFSSPPSVNHETISWTECTNSLASDLIRWIPDAAVLRFVCVTCMSSTSWIHCCFFFFFFFFLGGGGGGGKGGAGFCSCFVLFSFLFVRVCFSFFSSLFSFSFFFVLSVCLVLFVNCFL